MAELTKQELRKLVIANKIKDIDLKQTKPKIITAVRKQGYTVDVKQKTIKRSRGGKKRPKVKAEVIVKTRRVVKTPPRKPVRKAPVVKPDPPKKDPPKKDPPKKDPPKKGGKG